MHPKVLVLAGREIIFCLVAHLVPRLVPVTEAAGNTQGLAAAKEHCHGVRASSSSCFAFPASSVGQARRWEGTSWAADSN